MPSRLGHSPLRFHHSQSPLSIRRGFLIRIALVATFLLCGGAAVLWRMVHAEPVWYQPPVINEQRDELAGVIEYRIMEEAHAVREVTDEWTVRIYEDQVNAWLANRLLPWIEHEPTLYWPEGLAPPQVHLSSKGIDVGIEIILEDSHQVVVARLSPRVNESGGGIAIDLERIGAGRLLLPGDQAQRVREVVSDLREDESITAEIEQYITQLAEGGEALASEIELADDRTLRLQNIVCDEGYIDLTFRTLPAGWVEEEEIESLLGAESEAGVARDDAIVVGE